MKVTYFIDRPVFSAVISIVIVIIGIIGLGMLPIDQYPQITPPVVKISASYPGASALTVSQAVATPIEQELNGTPGMLYMESSSSNSGGFSATVTFDISADPDLSAVEIQNRIKLAESRLPTEVVQNGISVEKQASSQLMTLCLTSNDPKFDEIYLSNFATINVVDVLRRIPGVGRVSNVGSRYYAMQIWVQPDRLASFGLTVQDLQNALKDQNRESAAGVLGQQPVDGLDITIPISTKGRLSTVSQFEEIVLRANEDGSIIRLKDVARVSLEAQSYNTESGINGGNAAVLSIYMLPGANAIEVAENVKKAMEEISLNFPDGLTYEIPFDMTTYISESIHEVYKTLFEALFLVIIVVFLSLQSWRATLIPVVAVPISLIGTFGFMLIFGFSLNMLTLLGLILAIGIVVDDAIVVVENVERIMEEEKIGAYEATKKAMDGLAGALIATSLVLAAVFVPVSFLPGITGQLYRQFTVTIVVSVLISTVVALTLSPVMCSLILKPSSNAPKNIIFRKINSWLETGNNHYIRLISRIISHPRRISMGFCVVLCLIFVMHKLIPTSFLPVEDQGYFKVEIELPEGATLERTRAVTERAVSYLMKHPAVEYVQNVTGSSPRVGTSQSRSELTVILKPWTERDNTTIDKIMAEVKKTMDEYPESRVYLSTPPVIPGLGSSGGFEMQLEARGEASFEALVQAADTLLHYASMRKEITGLSSSLQAEIPQLYFDVDRDKVKLAGVPMADVFSTMKAYTGSVYVNDFNMFNRIYRVYIQAEADYREHQDNINLFFVRGNGGAMIPLTSLGNTSYTTGPGSIKRFNMFNSAVIRGAAADGYSSGQAMEAIEEVARMHLPDNIGIDWSGLSYQEKQAGGQTGMVLLLVFLFVFLFLAALYESWLVPVAVLMSLPVAALGAYAGIAACGLENDIYFQIGLVMLVGLAAKNAILIVEFAKEEVDKGGDIIESTLTAAKLRFRPILMTSLAFILGMLPMVIASGPGSASRQAIGTGVFFGMIVAVTVGILLVPFFFVMIYKAKQRFNMRKNISKVASVCLLALVFSSCQIGHKYTRPALQLPEKLSSAEADSMSVADIPWWNVYNDTTLTKLITHALIYNKDMAIATARMKELAELKRIDYANMFPKVDAKINANRENTDYGGNSFDSDDEFSITASVSWELDLWGNLRWARDRSKAQFFSSVENCRAVQMAIVAQVARDYFELMALDNELMIVRRTLEARKEGARLAELRFKGGVTSEIVYKQAQVEYAKTATMVPELERKIALKESELSVLLGNYPSIIQRNTISDEVSLPESLPVGLPSGLLERRPDIRKAEQELIAANAEVGMAYTNMFPRLTLTSNLGAESDLLSDLLKSPYSYISGTILSPVFAMGKNRASWKAKKAGYEAAVAEYEKVVLSAFKDVHDAIVDFNKIKQIYEARKTLAEASEKAVSLAQLQYINGVIGYLDLLDAQRSLFDAQISLSNAIRDKQITMVNLYKALGGGWK